MIRQLDALRWTVTMMIHLSTHPAVPLDLEHGVHIADRCPSVVVNLHLRCFWMYGLS